MFQTEWPVLLVDDDPDVLAVSKLAMKSFEIDGVPIKLFTATSKEEAVKLLSGPLGSTALPYVAVAFIDVVMETDHAGLDLCRYIRETQMNRMTTIYVRTGQPGLAPERDVIDRYDINGYFSKAETTEDKLYSLVKAGIRQFDFASMTVLEFQVIGHAMAAGGSVEGLQRAIGQVLGQIPTDPTGAPSRLGGYDIRVGLFEGDRLFGWQLRPGGSGGGKGSSHSARAQALEQVGRRLRSGRASPSRQGGGDRHARRCLASRPLPRGAQPGRHLDPVELHQSAGVDLSQCRSSSASLKQWQSIQLETIATLAGFERRRRPEGSYVCRSATVLD